LSIGLSWSFKSEGLESYTNDNSCCCCDGWHEWSIFNL
jgi:hypothetical protein